jgi:heat shock protein HslJ
MTELQALEKAVAVLGGQTETARQLNALLGRSKPLKQAHVWHWLNVGKRLPTKYAHAVEHLTVQAGGKVSASELCNDSFSQIA